MKVKVLSNINSGEYVAGDTAEFEDGEAEILIEAGAAEKFEETKSQTDQVPDGFPAREDPPAAPPQLEQPPQPPVQNQPAQANQPQQGNQPTPEEIDNTLAEV